MGMWCTSRPTLLGLTTSTAAAPDTSACSRRPPLPEVRPRAAPPLLLLPPAPAPAELPLALAELLAASMDAAVGAKGVETALLGPVLEKGDAQVAASRAPSGPAGARSLRKARAAELPTELQARGGGGGTLGLVRGSCRWGKGTHDCSWEATHLRGQEHRMV